MSNTKVLVVFGTRPEAIKMAPLVIGLKQAEGIDCKVCITAQHREMLDQVMSIFEITADYDLDLMRPGQDLYDITSRVLLGMREVLKYAQPDIVLVHGDTTTCFAAGLAAHYVGCKIGHIEAGLRTHNIHAPFPEEANRSFIARIADFHFAPTETSQKNLIKENIPLGKIQVTGNTVIDALLLAKEKVRSLSDDYWKGQFSERLYKKMNTTNSKNILITGHRRENFGEGFINLCNAIKTLAEKHRDWNLVYPVHLNPNVQTPVKAILSDLENVFLIEPQEYLPFVWLMDKCDLILTDSGGVQEEGPALGKPVLVMREVTERPEAVDAGTVRLVGTNPTKVVSGVEEVLLNIEVFNSMARAINPYGDGKAVGRIIQSLQGTEKHGECV